MTNYYMSVFADGPDKSEKSRDSKRPSDWSIRPGNPEGPIQSPSSSQKQKTVLIISDCDPAEKIYVALHRDYKVVYENNIEKGLANLAEWNDSQTPCDLVIFNEIPDQMSLQSFVAEARQLNETVPIILLAGSKEPVSKLDQETVDGLVFPESFLSEDLLSYVKGIVPKSTNLTDLRKKSKVLIVDDDQAVGKICSRTLTENGYDPNNVVYVNTRSAALQLLKSREFDIILSDFNMPGMKYKQFRESAVKLVEMKYKKKIWILLVSGNPREVIDTGAVADVYINKPFNFNKFVPFVDDLALKAKEERRQNEV